MAIPGTAIRTTDAVRWTPVVRVRGNSMRPALRDGQLLLTRPRGRRVGVGDIVVLTTQRGERRVKRIAAQPGDLVELEAGRFAGPRRCRPPGASRAA